MGERVGEQNGCGDDGVFLPLVKLYTHRCITSFFSHSKTLWTTEERHTESVRGIYALSCRPTQAHMNESSIYETWISAGPEREIAEARRGLTED